MGIGENSSKPLKTYSEVDLLAVGPAVLGFPVTESVLVLIFSRHKAVFTCRIDIDWFLTSYEFFESYIERILGRFPSSQVLLLGYSHDNELVRISLMEISHLMSGHQIIAILHTDERYWWSLDYGDDNCIEKNISYEDISTILAGQTSYNQIQIADAKKTSTLNFNRLSNQQELCQIFQRQEEYLSQISIDQLSDWLGEQVAAFLSRPFKMPKKDIVNMCVLLNEADILTMILRKIDTDNAAIFKELFTQLTTYCIDSYSVNCIGLLGMAYWLTGDSAGLAACLEKLKELDTNNVMFAILAQIQCQGLSSSIW